VPSHPFLTARWHHLVILTFETPEAQLAPLVPAGCELDRWTGRAYVSLVALHMDRVRVARIAVPGLTAFPQVNLRSYVRHANQPAVCFVQELVPSRLLAAVARWRFGEPFAAGRVELNVADYAGGSTVEYRFGIDRPHNRISVRGSLDSAVPSAATFEHWVKERARGCRTGRDGRLRTFDVAHPLWAVHRVESMICDVDFAALYGRDWAFLTDARPASVLYAVGSDVMVSAPSS
jgi:uncharacterized protein YqjF (DUF2071 family)